MRRFPILVAPFALMLLPCEAGAWATHIRRQPVSMRVSRADAVVVGRVLAHEPKDVTASAAGTDKATYRIAVVRITERLKGAKEDKTLRVGFLPEHAADPLKVPIAMGLLVRFGPPSLHPGQDGLFFLEKHPGADFFVASWDESVVARVRPDFDKERTEAQRVCRVLADPITHLKSADAAVRFDSATLLLTHYREPPFKTSKTEPLPAEESKLLLKALHESAEWQTPAVTPWRLFLRLELTKKDGWTAPDSMNLADHFEAARQWLRANADTYRIVRKLP